MHGTPQTWTVAVYETVHDITQIRQRLGTRQCVALHTEKL